MRTLESPHTRRGYWSDWGRFRVWLQLQGVALCEAKPRHIELYMAHLRDEQKKASATRARALAVICSVYGAFVRAELVVANPAREIHVKKKVSLKTPWLKSEDALHRLLAGVSNDTWRDRRARLGLCLFIGLGWRRAEVANIHLEDIHEGVITGTVKGNKEISVGLPQWLQVEIASWCEYAKIESGPLLPRAPGRRQSLTPDGIYKIIKAVARKVGFDADEVTPHALRRTFITLCAKSGVDLRTLQAAVGHTRLETTEGYDKAARAELNAPGEVFSTLVKPP